MKILVISGFFAPENTPRAFRTTELVKELSRLGHEVTVSIPDKGYDYAAYAKSPHVAFKLFKDYPIRRKYVGVSLIDRTCFYFENWLRDYPAFKSMKEVEKMAAMESGYDLLITIAVPHFIHWAVGRLYAKGHRIAKTWVADCGDPYMLNKIGKKKPFYFKPYEIRWCRYCDYISVPIESDKNHYYPEFREKIKVIPQGFNFDELKEGVENPKNDVVTFAYAGTFIKYVRDPRPLLDYLVESGKDFKFILFGPDNYLVDQYKDTLGDKLEMRGSLPRLELIKQLRQCDFLLNIDNGNAGQRPSKLIDYALTGRPILSVSSADLDKSKIDKFLNRDYTQQYVVDNIEQYDIHNVAQQFLELCSKES